jgi:glyceraldehyde 3-phosphate dehydrogenase
MTIRVGINGYGRIGRAILRANYERAGHDVAIVAINDLGSPEANAHLTRYDATHGRFSKQVRIGGDVMTVGGDPIKMFARPDPVQIPWATAGVDVVLECTGLFRTREKASAHFEGGARKVVISALADGEVDATIAYGINHEALRVEHSVISNGSCALNCLAPIAQPLHECIGIVSGVMANIHGYMSDKALIDSSRPDPRRARAAAMNMTPVTSGIGEAIGFVLPPLRRRLHGYGVRVPIINVALVILTFVAARDTTVAEVNAVVHEASRAKALAGVLNYGTAPLVSIEYNHDPASATFDPSLTSVSGRLVKVVAWYDNEWGFANRMLDTTIALMRARGSAITSTIEPGAMVRDPLADALAA